MRRSPAATVLAKKAGIPEDLAEAIVNGVPTSPAMAGKVFARAGARISAMWHLAVDHETVGPVFEEMRSQYERPVVVSQDLTVFDINADAIIVRQTTLDPVAWPSSARRIRRDRPCPHPTLRPRGGPTRSSPASCDDDAITAVRLRGARSKAGPPEGTSLSASGATSR
jgi:hypothetical protein